MDEEIERRKRFLFERLGEEGLKILRQNGIDVESGVTKILQEQEDKRQKLEMQAEFPTANDIMTSELVYRSAGLDDVMGKEYRRRLSLIGFDDKQIESLYTQEALVAISESLKEHRKQPWVIRYFIIPGTTPDSLPKVEDMTLSELVLITDDANSAMSRDHHVLPAEAMAAVCIAACSRGYTEARYIFAFNERTERLGWSKAQSGAYARNEWLLTERLKWGMHEDPAWTEKTTDLKQYER